MGHARVHVRVAVALLAALLFAGCGGDDDAAPAETGVDGEAAGDDGGADDTGAPEDTAADGDDAADEGGDPGSDGDRPTGTVAVEQTQVHPNGVELTVQAVRVEGDGIHLDIEAFNGSLDLAYLAVFDEVGLVDDTGRSYNFLPPEDNPGLEIETGGTLEGSLAFLGRLTPGATSVTVRFNHDGDEELGPHEGDHADLTDAPSFEFADLPLPGTDG